MRSLRSLGFALPIVLCLPLPAAASTVTGHSLVVEIAVPHLSERAIARIRELLGRDPDELADLSTWADDIILERPETEPWHTVDTARQRRLRPRARLRVRRLHRGAD